MTGPGPKIVLYPRDPQRLTLEELAQTAHLHPELLQQFIEFGLIEPVAQDGPTLIFEAGAVLRVRLIQRLRRDLGVNLPGVAVILDLTDRLRAMRWQLDWLRNRL